MLCCDIKCALWNCAMLEYILTGLESSKWAQANTYKVTLITTQACLPLWGKQTNTFLLCISAFALNAVEKRPWRAPPGPKVHLSLQHTGQTASLKYTHLPMFIHCRPLESKYNVECKGLKPPLFHQLTKSPTVGSFFSLWYFQSSTHKKELVLDAFP